MNSKIDFINGNITDTIFGRNFDNIWLSNVAHYLKYNSIMPMVEHVSKALNIDGKLLLCYYWNTCMTVKGFKIDELEKEEYEKINIPGTTRKYGKNSILIYKKKK